MQVMHYESSREMLKMRIRPYGGTECDLGTRKRRFNFKAVRVGFSFWMKRREYKRKDLSDMITAVNHINKNYNAQFHIIYSDDWLEIGRIR